MPAYIIRVGDSGPVKIGYAEDVQARIKTLQTAHALPISVLRVVDGDSGIEAALHEQFEDRHVRGEWFDYDEEMLTFDPGDQPPGRKRRSSTEAANAALSDLFTQVTAANLAKITGASVRTVEAWKMGRRGPGWHAIAALLRHGATRAILMEAAFKAEPPMEKRVEWDRAHGWPSASASHG